MGTALFRPATYALLGGLVSEERLRRSTALYGAMRDAGQVLGPAVAGGLLLLASPELVLGLNAVTFVALRAAAGRPARPRAPGRRPPRRTSRQPGRTLAHPVRALIGTSGAVAFAAATMNVGELVLAQRDLAAGPTGYALLVSAYGCGLVAGSLRAGRGGDERRRHVVGIAVLGVGMVATALAPVLAAALVTFAVTGFGNGLFIVSNRRAAPARGARALPRPRVRRARRRRLVGLRRRRAGRRRARHRVGGRATFALSGAALLILFAAHALRRAPERAARPATATA